jgi:Ser/Thr protein kinase RdoA (MazF antagonist)
MAGEYTPEVVADLHLMVAGALDHWGLSPRTTVTLLNLSENATFMLSDRARSGEDGMGGHGEGRESNDPTGVRERGGDLVLRVHRVGYSSAEEIRSELEWINALRRDAVIETATPLPGLNGELVQTLVSPAGRAPRYAVAFEHLAGREPDAGADAPRWFERLGEITARMHRHSKSWILPAGFCRKRWDMDAMVGDKGHWGPWRDAIGLDGAGSAVLEQALSCIRQRTDRFGMSPERFGLVHADLRLANLLTEDAHLRIIDFDDCGFSWFMYDFATAISFIEHEAIVADLLEAWVFGYCKVAPLTAEERAEIPTFVVLRRILLTAWLASHAEVPLARQLGAEYTAGTVELARKFLSGQFLDKGCVRSDFV